MAEFRFKQFTVQHDRSTMRVGTDAVLLGAWCDLVGARRVLDVGTGCGVIALMVAQRTAGNVLVQAIDIDPVSVAEATVNFARSPWSQRLHCSQADYNSFCPAQPLDCVVTNPPYFAELVMPPDAVRSAARHTHALSFQTLMLRAASQLSEQGSIALVAPTNANDAIIEAATFAGLSLWRQTEVCTVQGADAKRVLWQWSKRRHDILRSTLTIQLASGNYAEPYRRLCRDFYLKF